MLKQSEITISSKNNIIINNLYFRHETGAKTLVVVFPGGGYSCEMPLLYYCSKAALQIDCDVITLKYFFQCAKIEYSNSDDTQVVQDCYNAVKTCILNTNLYENTIFISKSIGAVYASKTELLLTERKVRHFYITPLPKIISFIDNVDCTVIIGDKDTLISKESMQKIKTSHTVKVHILNNLDHSLENPRNCIESLKALITVTNLFMNFLSAI